MKLTLREDALCVGKLAMVAGQRGRGLARALMAVGERQERARGLTELELEARVELVKNQAAFVATEFVEVERKAHAGFDQALRSLVGGMLGTGFIAVMRADRFWAGG